MNKADLIERIAERADVSKSCAARALEALISAVEASLAAGDTVNLAGFGSFSVAQRAARAGRNPKTGEVLAIQAARVARFKPGKALKDAIRD
ncbi:MAG: HU family DNA-binding protein [Rhodocyclaceae bacterium]|nr:HU family DNA-binding protein [Rhodocyclaceae bacterium]